MGRVRKNLAVLAGTLIALTPAAATWASPVILPLIEKDWADFASPVAATGAVHSPFNYNNAFVGSVTAQAFLLDSGDYLYLYQVANDGPTILEVLAVAPFGTVIEAGTVDVGEPADFLAGGLDPLGITHDAGVPDPVASFNYPSATIPQRHIPAGQHSNLLYLVSPHEPTSGEAYVIGGGVAAVPTIVPMPEPVASGVLILGSVFAVLRKRRRS